jgi:ubiquinone/menaquinone biosynthesis C-methylase UbiE
MPPEFIRKYISGQFGRPSGVFGRMIERSMSKRTTVDAEWTLSLLNIQPTSYILEIGFGGGVSTQLASQKASQGFVAGIDHSTIMVQAASKRNAGAIKAGRMELKQGDAGDIPYPDESFDIVFSLHSIYFWHNPHECLQGFRRVLKPGGLLAITIQPKNKWREEQLNTSGMILFFGNQICEMFSAAGFQNVRMESHTENEEISLQCILGNK